MAVVLLCSPLGTFLLGLFFLPFHGLIIFHPLLLSQNYVQTLYLSALLSLRYKDGTNHLIFSYFEGDFDVVTRRERSGICYHPKPVLNYHQRTYFTYAKLHFCWKTSVYKQFIFLNKLNSYFGVCLTFSLY